MLAARRALLALSLPLALAACGDPLRDVDRLSDVDVAEEAGAATVAPLPADQADAPGFLARLFNGTLTSETAPVEAVVIGADGEAVAAEVLPVGGVDVLPPIGTDMIPGDSEMDSASAPVEPAPRRQGLFGLLDRLGTERQDGAGASGPDGALIPPGTTLAYGEIATVCGLRASDMGRVVGRESGYTVYDTNPGTTAQRTHYVTGFNDGCARQFRAALVLFGDVGTHEVIRYSDGTRDLPYSDTDNAYEEIKARVCRVSARQPCGSAIDRLARRTTFLSVYSNFEINPEWADILLSDGEVVAMDFKG